MGLLLIFIQFAFANGHEVDCKATRLEDLIQCITQHMPGKKSNRYSYPTAAQKVEWGEIVSKMLEGECEGIKIKASLVGKIKIFSFLDEETLQTYCVLMEVSDQDKNGTVDQGLGTFVVNPKASRAVCHAAPHPLSDKHTERQAITLFKETNSMSFLMAGAVRSANEKTSPCQSEYEEADAAHNVNNLFHVTTQKLREYYSKKAWTQIQWHGMKDTACPGINVFLSSGTLQKSSIEEIKLLEKKLRVLNPTWNIHVYDGPNDKACELAGIPNVQSRILQGVSDSKACTEAADIPNGRFIHIEQQPNFRNARDWIEAIKSTF